jgi:hypothetical protein
MFALRSESAASWTHSREVSEDIIRKNITAVAEIFDG